MNVNRVASAMNVIKCVRRGTVASVAGRCKIPTDAGVEFRDGRSGGTCRSIWIEHRWIADNALWRVSTFRYSISIVHVSNKNNTYKL